MKTGVNIILLLLFLVAGPAVAVVKLFGPKRNVIVQIRRENGAVIIDGKKVRVPYTMQQTAIPTRVDGVAEFLFLDDQQLCLVTALIELTMGLSLVLLYHINTVESGLRAYRPILLKTLLLGIVVFVASEFISHYVSNDWLIDIKNGVNGNAGLFGVNATFQKLNDPVLDLDYHPATYLFMIMLIALIVVTRNRRDREEPELDLQP
jgi:hypothetical protein